MENTETNYDINALIKEQLEVENDFVNGQGVCVSFWCQGCPLHCPGCHNPQTWDFEGGLEAAED